MPCRSTNLAKIAEKHEPHSVIVADNLSLPHPPNSFDFAISIAVIHHLSTPSRRIAAITAILEILRPSSTTPEAEFDGGKVLIYVWALEQKGSRRGWDEGHEQDVMVPWVMKGKDIEENTFYRYYHLYKKGELDENVREAGGVVLDAGYEKDNWWVVAGKSR